MEFPTAPTKNWGRPRAFSGKFRQVICLRSENTRDYCA
jgi:hypothetical protein